MKQRCVVEYSHGITHQCDNSLKPYTVYSSFRYKEIFLT